MILKQRKKTEKYMRKNDFLNWFPLRQEQEYKF